MGCANASVSVFWYEAGVPTGWIELTQFIYILFQHRLRYQNGLLSSESVVEVA